VCVCVCVCVCNYVCSKDRERHSECVCLSVCGECVCSREREIKRDVKVGGCKHFVNS